MEFFATASGTLAAGLVIGADAVSGGGLLGVSQTPCLITALIDFTAAYRKLDEQKQADAHPVYLMANALLASEMTAAEADAAGLASANEKASCAHRTHERRALNLQMNDKTGFFA